MKIIEKYWMSVAERIAADFKNGHPENWKKGDIELFLSVFLSKLQEICRQDTEKAERCGVPKIKGEARYDQLKYSYYSFRRIFITKESEGNLTTKEMFAIYFGYDSYNDYLIKEEIKGEEDAVVLSAKVTQLDNNPQPLIKRDGNRSKALRFGAITLVMIILIGLSLATYFSETSETSEKIILFRHDNGITIINTKDKKPVQIRAEPKITGIDIDVEKRLIFWSSYPFGHISKGRLSENFNRLEPGYTIFNLIDSIPGPAGIAVNPKEEVFYCAMYRDSTIAMYHYNGQLLNGDLIEGLKGRPSSLELDVKNQILYWTDVSNGKIGRFDLSTKEIDHSFIKNAGYYPDGLSIDTINNILYWTNRHDRQIGWASLSDAHLFFVNANWETAAVEIDAENNSIYYSAGKSDFIKVGAVTKDGINFNIKNSLLETGGFEPSVLKIIKIN